MKIEQTECSEMSAYKFQMPGNYPEESIQHSEQGESVKSTNEPCLQSGVTYPTFCLSSTYILISSQYSFFCTCILRILGITFSPLNSANLREITTLVVCIPFNFAPCYSSVIIQQQFLIPCTHICILKYV